MLKATAAAVLTLTLCWWSGTQAQPQCLHGQGETAEQTARRRDALQLTRFVNTAQANQAGARAGTYLRQADLGGAQGLDKLRSSRESFANLSFEAGQEVFPGWVLDLDVTQDGYWFMIKDKTDPCGFAYISNKGGTIYTAEPIR